MAKGSGTKSTTNYVAATYNGPRTSTATGVKGGADFWSFDRFMNELRASYSITSRTFQMPHTPSLYMRSPYARGPSTMDLYEQRKQEIEKRY